jgi:hypothetical protein
MTIEGPSMGATIFSQGQMVSVPEEWQATFASRKHPREM